MGGWTPRASAELYEIATWGHGYFSVGEQGHVCVHPRGEAGPSLDLFELVRDLRSRDCVGLSDGTRARGNRGR